MLNKAKIAAKVFEKFGCPPLPNNNTDTKLVADVVNFIMEEAYNLGCSDTEERLKLLLEQTFEGIDRGG